MKKIIQIVLAIFLLLGCQNKKKNEDNVEKEAMEKAPPDFGPIELSDWESTPHVKGTLASQLDIDEGRAVFLIDPEGGEHKPLEIEIPSLAHITDEESNKQIKVVVIQGEKIGESSIVGIRYLSGGDGVCMLEELDFIDNEKI